MLVERLDQQISQLRGLLARSQSGADRAAYLYGLGLALQVRFDLTGSAADLAGAVEAGREAVATPADHPDLAARLSSLGFILLREFDRTGQAPILEEAINTSRQAVALTPPDDPARKFRDARRNDRAQT